MIVSALRVPQQASTVTSAVTQLDPNALQNQGILNLRSALNEAPGVISTSTSGNSGAPSSLFIRGTNTNQSQVVIDGMRVGDSNAQPNNLLAGIRTYDLGAIEVLRGPQGAIYGGESAGGVLWMETPHGSGDPSGKAFFETGSFNSLATHGIFQGQSGDVSYFLAGGYEETDNDGPNQHFNQSNVALRVEGQASDIWTIGTTYRGTQSYYENQFNPEVEDDNSLVTLYATGRISDRWTSRFLVGYHQELYDTEGPYGHSGTDNEMAVISTDQEITLAENVRLLAGAFFRQNDYDNGSIEENSDRYGLHSALEWDIIDDLTASASLRWEDYDYYGQELTWRLGSIYNIESSGTSIRGGVGTSFRAPGYLDVYGNPGWGINPNPDIESESSLGWDIGVAQKFAENHTAEMTWFHNRFTDRIAYYYDPMAWQGQYVNISGDSVTEGIEFALRGSWLDEQLSYHLAWTWLNKSLSDHPQNSANASLDWKPTEKALVGIGATYLSSHSWGNNPDFYKQIDGCVLTRLHASYQVSERIKLHTRIENVLDEEYLLSDIYGAKYEGSGTGIYAGITVDW